MQGTAGCIPSSVYRAGRQGSVGVSPLLAALCCGTGLLFCNARCTCKDSAWCPEARQPLEKLAWALGERKSSPVAG